MVLGTPEKHHNNNGSAVSGVTNSESVEREAGHGKPASTWSEHVWSTFIHRGFSDDVTERPNIVVGKGSYSHVKIRICVNSCRCPFGHPSVFVLNNFVKYL